MRPVSNEPHTFRQALSAYFEQDYSAFKEENIRSESWSLPGFVSMGFIPATVGLTTYNSGQLMAQPRPCKRLLT